MTLSDIQALLAALAARKSHLTDWDEAQLDRIGQIVAAGDMPGERDLRTLEAFRAVADTLPADPV